MTGFGEARHQSDALGVGVEVRAVNNRYLKVTVRGTDPYPMLEPELEKVVRRHVRRGTLLVHVRVDRQARAADLTLNAAALTSYLRQVQKACETVNLPPACQPQVYAGVLALPGVAPEGAYFGSPPEEEWPLVEQTLEAALKNLDAMRREEGRAMAAELLAQQRHVGAQLDAIRQQLPGVMAEYRQRLIDRIRQAIKDTAVTVEPEHLVREVALFADRSDVSEEVTRLASHLDQFAEVVRKGDEGAGRKLEFVIQEMGRETNTLGSKAGDVTVSRHVVEIKATLEKIRELVQNVE
jgi:uncharacterized protein (TIGR00255 family)